MRFRALLVDNAAMKDLLSTVNSLSKLSKDCVMRIVSRKVYFIIPDEDTGPRKPLAWCELPVNFYFKEFNLDGVSQEYNEIYLCFATAMLAKSLSTVKQNAKSLKIKLTNKQTPCLTLEIELASNEGLQNRQLVHDIPVEIIARKNWNDFAEPQFNDFHNDLQVSIEMPHLKPIKNIVERMKNMSHSLIVSANNFGRLSLQIKTNMVNLSAHFTNLGIQSFAVGQDNESTVGDGSANESIVTATIDIKKFLMFLTGMQLNHCRTTCSIVHGKMVKLASEQVGALSLQCFLQNCRIKKYKCFNVYIDILMF